jgi:hypothetical protein
MVLLAPPYADTVRMAAQGTGQVEVKAGYSRGRLIYELKVPLRPAGNGHFTVCAAPGAVIGVGLETPEIKFDAQPQRGPKNGMGGKSGMGGMGGGPPGGMGGGGFGGPGRPSGGPDHEATSRPTPLNLWCTIKLAATTADTTLK